MARKALMSPHHLLTLLLHEGMDDTGMDRDQPGHSPSPGHPEGGISGQSGYLEEDSAFLSQRASGRQTRTS